MNRLHLQLIRSLTGSVLADIEWTPHILDKERVLAAYKETTDELERLGVELAQVTGGINLNSPQQLAAFLYDELGFAELRKNGVPIRNAPNKKNPEGTRKADNPTLVQLKATNNKQRRFLETYRDYNELASKVHYLRAFKVMCERYNCEFYGELAQCRTRNHRLGGNSVKVVDEEGNEYNIQPQNIPREFKRLFTCPEGWSVGEPDGSQLEFRVAAELGRDDNAKADIRNKVDVHANTAAAFLAAGDPKFTKLDDPKERRQQAKPETFKPLYGGMGSDRFQKAYREFFITRYPQIAGTQKGWCYEALKSAERAVKLPYGMVFKFPQAKMSGSGYIEGTTQIYNYPVSSFATGEIIPITMICLWLRSDRSKFKIFSAIHDSVPTFVKQGHEEEFVQLCVQAFTYDTMNVLRDVYDYTFTTPLGCGIKVGANWGEGAEVAYDLDPVTGKLEVKEGKEWKTL